MYLTYPTLFMEIRAGSSLSCGVYILHTFVQSLQPRKTSFQEDTIKVIQKFHWSGWLLGCLSINLMHRNVCYNVILIEAKSLRNWQHDKSLRGDVLSHPYLALHISCNRECCQSCAGLCVRTVLMRTRGKKVVLLRFNRSSHTKL